MALRGPKVSIRVNPAALASPPSQRLSSPSVSLSQQGELADNALGNILKFKDFEHLENLGYHALLGKTVLWTDIQQGVRFDHFEIGFGGSGQFAGRPNRSARLWARQGHFGVPPPESRLVLQLGYQFSADLAYGRRFNLSGPDGGTLDVGVAVYPGVARYQEQSLRASRAGDIIQSIRADDLKFGVAVDLGVRYVRKATPEYTFGAVLRGVNEGGAGELKHQRMLSFGAARELGPRLRTTADWINVGSAGVNPTKAAIGVEYDLLPRWIALRGAVTTRGLAGGIDLGPLTFAYAADGTSLLSTGFSF